MMVNRTGGGSHHGHAQVPTTTADHVPDTGALRSSGPVWRSLGDDNINQQMRSFYTAVKSENWEVVGELLEQFVSDSIAHHLVDLLTASPTAERQNERLKEALLMAVSSGSRPVVEMVLLLFKDHANMEQNVCEMSTAFPKHITPLMLACIGNNAAIVQCLLLRGHRLTLPHRFHCRCKTCIFASDNGDPNLARLDAFRAICSDAFLWLGTADPLLAAFRLSDEITQSALYDSEYTLLYGRLLLGLRNFVNALCGQLRTVEEVGLILRQRNGISISDCSLNLPRFRLALDCRMKQFLANSNVHMLVHFGWKSPKAVDVYAPHVEHDPDASTIESSMKNRRLQETLRYCIHAMYPVTGLVHLAVERWSGLESFKTPYGRYLSFAFSYVYFAIFLIVDGLYRFDQPKSDRSFAAHNVRFGLQIYIWIYLFGLFIYDFCMFWKRGVRKYFAVWWHWFDFVMLSLFFAAFHCWVLSLIRSKDDQLPQLNRRHWVPYDSHLMFDLFYAAGSIMAYWRSFYFVQRYRNIGSTVVAFGRCAAPILNYLLIMFVVMASFAFGINLIYRPYESNVASKLNDYDPTFQYPHFTSFSRSLVMLYWAFYGYLPPWEMQIVPGDAGPHQHPMKHAVTESVGEIVLAVYHVVIIIAMLNLLISLLVRTADTVMENEDVEWKYDKCHIYAEYFEASTTLPPPFNLIYLIKELIVRTISSSCVFTCTDLFIHRALLPFRRCRSTPTSGFMKWFFSLFCGCGGCSADKAEDADDGNFKYDEEAADRQDGLKELEAYQKLMVKLFKRIVLAQQHGIPSAVEVAAEKDLHSTPMKCNHLNK